MGGRSRPASPSPPPRFPHPPTSLGSCRRHSGIRTSCLGVGCCTHEATGQALLPRPLGVPGPVGIPYTQTPAFTLWCEGCDSGCIPSPALLLRVQCVDSKVTEPKPLGSEHHEKRGHHAFKKAGGESRGLTPAWARGSFLTSVGGQDVGNPAEPTAKPWEAGAPPVSLRALPAWPLRQAHRDGGCSGRSSQLCLRSPCR